MSAYTTDRVGPTKGPISTGKEGDVKPRDFIHETGADLNLSEDPTEDDLGFKTEED